MKKRNIALWIFFMWMVNPLLASGDNPDFFRSIGKIYVVVAVIIAIFIGIIAFLIYLERKVADLENNINYTDNE